jgi:signal transduction histidine kinase
LKKRLSFRAKLVAGNAAVAAVIWLIGLLVLVASGIWKPVSHLSFFIALIAGALVVMFLFGMATWFIAGRALARVKEMSARLRRLSAENLDKRLPVENPRDELGEFAAGFNDALEQLQNSFAALDRLTADVSHELRTPLTAMRAVSEVALRERNPAVLHDAVGSMLEEIGRMNQLLDRLLLLTRPGDDAMPVSLEAGPVRKTLLEVSDALGLLAEDKQQSLLVDCPDHLLAVFDPALLRLALMNLVQNAIRYSPPGKPIKVRALADNGAAVIEVADEGPGIAPEHQQKIFERFYRVDKARSRAEGGVGLGLAIVKWAAERMGGALELKSEPGYGSTFRLRLRTIQS